MSLNIRQLHEGCDLSGAIRLMQRLFSEEGFDTPPERIAANVERMAGVEACGLFLAEDGDEAIGIATVSLEFGIEFGWSAEMGDLYVVPELRGKGISRRLVGAVEEFLRAKGATGYQVTVTPFAEEHHGLAAFYDGLGFVGEGRLIRYKQLLP